MKKIYTLITFLLLNKLSFGQNDSLNIFKKNEIKFDIFHTLGYSDKNNIAFLFNYERILTKKNNSIQLSLAINDKFGLTNGAYGFVNEPNIYHSVLSKSITINYNFVFPFKNKFSSFSLFPLIKSIFFKDNITNTTDFTSNYSTVENRFSVAGGLGIANKWIWMDKISYQIFATGSKSILKAKSKYQIMENRFEPKVGVNLGFRF